MTEDLDAGVLVITKNAPTGGAAHDAALETETLLAHLREDHAAFGAVIDLRAARLDDESRFELGLGTLAAVVAERCARVALVVASFQDMRYAGRVLRGPADRVFIGLNADEAITYAEGEAERRVRTSGRHVKRHAPRLPPPESAGPSHGFDYWQGLAEENVQDERIVRAIRDARGWARDLEEWAIVREKVIASLDIAAAKKGRALAASLRRGALDLENAGAESAARIRTDVARLEHEAMVLMFAMKPERSSKRPTRRPTVKPGAGVVVAFAPSSSKPPSGGASRVIDEGALAKTVRPK